MNKENDYVEKKLKQRKKKSLARFAKIILLALITLAVLFGGYKLVSGLIGKGSNKNETKTEEKSAKTDGDKKAENTKMNKELLDFLLMHKAQLHPFIT